MKSISSTCKAVVFTAVDEVQFLDIPMPRVEKSSDAVLRVVACGICGSDLHPFHGREGCAFGTAFGHECVGVVVAVGCDVTSFAIGDRCAVPFSVACGNCFYCKEGMSARCDSSQLFGWKNPADSSQGLHGAQSEYVRIPVADGSLYRLNSEISNDEGLLLGDIASTAAYAAAQAGLAGWDNSNGNPVFALEQLLCRTTTTSADMGGEGMRQCKFIGISSAEKLQQHFPVYVVIGCGPVGLLAIAMARLMLLLRGYSNANVCIFAVDSVPERLDFARKWGATPLLLKPSPAATTTATTTTATSPAEDSLPPPLAATSVGVGEDLKGMSTFEIISAIRAASLSRGRSGRGADAVIECVGANSALLSAYDIVAPAGIVSSIGVHSTQFPFSPADVYDKNLTYKSGRCPARSLMSSVEKLLRISKDPDNGLGCNMILTDIITHRFPLSDGANGYEIFDKKQDGCIKAVLYPPAALDEKEEC